MRLARYVMGGVPGVAAARSDRLFHGLSVGDHNFPGDIDDVIAQGPDALVAAAEACFGGKPIDLERAQTNTRGHRRYGEQNRSSGLGAHGAW